SPVRLACGQDGDGRRWRDQERRGAPSARASAPGDAGGIARARRRGQPAGAAVGPVAVTATLTQKFSSRAGSPPGGEGEKAEPWQLRAPCRANQWKGPPEGGPFTYRIVES